MIQKTKFVLLLVALCLSLAVVTQASCKPNKKETTVSENMSKVTLSNNLGELHYQPELELRNDIPFSLLVDKEFKKKLGDSIDYEKFRPDFIFLKKAFNEKDTAQLSEFGCILVSVLSNPNNTPYVLNNDFIDNLVMLATHNLEGTSYRISSWENLNKNAVLPDGTVGVEFNYKQQNTDTQKVLDVTSLYLIKNDKLITINMSAPDSQADEWKGYYQNIVSNLQLK